jgi:CRP/FNR family transcriptional regulator, nitrogen fixation regulation protein
MKLDLPAARFDEPVWTHARLGSPRSVLQSLDSLGSSSRYERDQEVYREESPVGCWYRLISGAARRYSVRPDGRRQIVDVLLPGDMFGFGNRSKHAFSAEAIADGTLIARYPLARIQALAASEPEAAQELRELVMKSMERLHSLLLILGRTTAEEKVGCFLLLMQRRVGCGPTGRLVLPLTRYDVADYLALSVETVSRCLTALKQRGVISLSGPRQIGIVDRDALVDQRDVGQRDVGVIDRDALPDERKRVETRPAPPRTAPQVPAAAQSRIVEIRVPAFAFAETLSEMRGWLDHRRCDPSRFTCVREGSGAVVARVEFRGDMEELAVAFKQEFARPLDRTDHAREGTKTLSVVGA